MATANMLTALSQQGAANPLLAAAPSRLSQLRDKFGTTAPVRQWGGKVHVVSSKDGQAGVKVHGVFADEAAAKIAHKALSARRRDDQEEGPHLQAVDVGGDIAPSRLSLVTEAHQGGPVIMSAHETHGDAKKSAEEHAKLFWNAGHQSTPDELSAGWLYKAKAAWNAEHPNHKVDRDFDFVEPADVPRELQEQHKAIYQAEFNRAEDFPGLRKANARQEAFGHLDRGDGSPRSGVFNVLRMAVT